MSSCIDKTVVQNLVASGSNVATSAVRYVDRDTFKEENKDSENGLDKILCNIANLQRIERNGIVGYGVTMQAGEQFFVNTRGVVQRWNVVGKKLKAKARISGGHLFFKDRTYDNRDISLERLVYALEGYYNNELPAKFSGFHVNCKDLCGSIKNKLGVEYNIHPSNLELVTDVDNLKHSHLAHAIYKITGKAYRFTAKDTTLAEIVADGDVDTIEWYMDLCRYPRVK